VFYAVTKLTTCNSDKQLTRFTSIGYSFLKPGMGLHSREQNDISRETFGWFYGCNISTPEISKVER